MSLSLRRLFFAKVSNHVVPKPDRFDVWEIEAAEGWEFGMLLAPVACFDNSPALRARILGPLPPPPTSPHHAFSLVGLGVAAWSPTHRHRTGPLYRKRDTLWVS